MSKRCVLGLYGIMIVIGGCNPHMEPTSPPQSRSSTFRASAIRYQVADVERAAAFYTEHLGFQIVQKQGPAFASIANGHYLLWLSGPGSSGARAMPDGTKQSPGGWNRLVLEVDDIHAVVARMKQAGFNFRNDIEKGPGGQQIQLEDLDGNALELFQPASRPGGQAPP